MSQRINVRLADSRRGSQAFVAIVAVLLLVGAGIGGWWWWSTKPKDENNVPAKRDADKQVGIIYGGFTDSLNDIAEDPAKLDEETKSIKKLSDEDAETLKTDFAAASAEMKKKVLDAKAAEEPKLKEAWDKAMATAGVKEKLEPTAKALKDKLDAIK